MKKYTVIRNYMISDTYTVIADTPEMAKELVIKIGAGKHIGTTHDDDDHSVEVYEGEQHA